MVEPNAVAPARDGATASRLEMPYRCTMWAATARQNRKAARSRADLPPWCAARFRTRLPGRGLGPCGARNLVRVRAYMARATGASGIIARWTWFEWSSWASGVSRAQLPTRETLRHDPAPVEQPTAIAHEGANNVG